MQQEIRPLKKEKDISIYKLISPENPCERFIVSSPETRSICNDTTIAGMEYTNRLKKACSKVFKNHDFGLQEKETVVVNILRGSLNFGLREALADAYGWKYHNTSFVSAQRARHNDNPDSWYITENAYKKIYFPKRTSLIIGDVVATGTSLHYALEELINTAEEQKVEIKSIVFFTYGGPKAEEILAQIDQLCRKHFPNYEKTNLIYLEGRFTVPELSMPLHTYITGTDLLRYKALMAPEFIEAQYESPLYPLERCIIYDAGSRAFWIPEYTEDVINYWNQVLQLSIKGMTFTQLILERMPRLDSSRFGKVDLTQLAIQHIKEIKETLILK